MDDMITPSYLFRPEINAPSKKPLDFLFDKPDLQKIVSELCEKLHHPIALIDYKALMKMNASIQLESTVAMFPMRRACSVFRKCAGESFCKQCDCFHATCMDRDQDAIDRRIQENLNRVPHFFYPEYKDRRPVVLEGFDRPVIEYHCPMLGYRELLFPLIYQDSIFGVFFVGQIVVYDKEDTKLNQKISESFFKETVPKELFRDFVEKNFGPPNDSTEKIICDTIAALIMDSDSDARPYDDILGLPSHEKEENEYSKRFYEYKDYLAFIRTVCGAIADMEKELHAAYEKRRTRIFSATLKTITDLFFEEHGKVHCRKFRNKHDTYTEELKSAWEALEKVFASEILRQFDYVEGILLFGDSQGITIEMTGKKEIVFAVSSVRNTNKVTKEGTFDFSVNSIDGINGSVNSITNPAILDGLSEGLPKENSILIQCHDIAVLLLVKDLDANRELYRALMDAINEELVRLNSIIALCSANLMKEKYLLTLRMYRHENAHISTRLMGTIDRYFDAENSGQRFRNAESQKQKLVCNDLRNTVQLFANIADNISFITGTGIAAESSMEDVSRFDVVDMLYKWQVMFQDNLENRNLEIIVYRGGYDPSTVGYKMAEYLFKFAAEITRPSRQHAEAPREITINPRLFELLVYNIVDNAVKYAYIGTNIYLIWSRAENDYELSVTSYGPKMPEGDTMYGLYVRGNDKRWREGDGLGLYVVKRISEKLGITVGHDSEKISSYNIPLIPWYIKTDFSRDKGYPKISETLLNANNDTQQVLLATNDYPPTRIQETDLTLQYLKERIEMETWRTTFRVRIPQKDK